jgi:hypothetical protein
MVTTAATAICRYTSSAAVTCSRRGCAANIDAAAGSVEEVSRIVNHVRGHWPKVRMVLRADSGFAHDALMSWCEAHQVDFVFGLAKNDRLKAQIITEMAKAQAACEQSGQPARALSPASSLRQYMVAHWLLPPLIKRTGNLKRGFRGLRGFTCDGL